MKVWVIKNLCLIAQKSLENKTTLNIVNVSYSFTQFSTLAKIYTTTAREPSIYPASSFLDFSNPLYSSGRVLLFGALVSTLWSELWDDFCMGLSFLLEIFDKYFPDLSIFRNYLLIFNFRNFWFNLSKTYWVIW